MNRNDRGQRRRNRTRAAFTLMEVLLVLAILGVIGALVVPNLLGRQQKANIDAAKNDIKRIEANIETYAIENNGKVPESLQVLTEPYEKEGVEVEPVLDAVPLDPWGNAYNYAYPGTHHTVKSKPDLWSSGPDGKNDSGDGDDVSNWDKTSA